MNALRSEALAYWQAAERDWITFDVLTSSPRSPVESLCFNAQQYVEKLLKTVLVLRGVAFRRTHDVVSLAEQLQATGSELPAARDMLKKLSPCAVIARYEGLPMIEIGRAELVAIVAQARQWAEQLRTDYSLP